MAGTVAVGALLSSATVRVLDATGKAIATGKPVSATTGAYGPIALSGGGPYRVEACGSFGGRLQCLYGATTLGGTLHLTPVTSAITVLAANLPPEGLMSGAVQGLDDTALAAAHAQVRTALAPALTDAGLPADHDLLAGALAPGSHTGYDRLLDGLRVSLGQDGSTAFAQFSPRWGSGVAYLEAGSSSAALSLATGTLDLAGLDGLFNAMVTATANNNSCQSGLVPLFDTNARVSIDTLVQAGPTLAAQLLCLRLAGVLGDGEVLFGGKLLPPELGRCELGTEPLCRVSFNWQTPKGEVRVLGTEQAAVQRTAGWRFLGNRLDVQASATARLALTRRTDASAPDAFKRYLDIPIPAASGLQCARVTQKDASGADQTLGYYKRGLSGSRLSLWSQSNGSASLDPNTGALLGVDQIALPVADATIRTLLRGGRSLRVDLYTDSACTAPWAGADGPSLSLDLAGMPPLSPLAQTGQPWPVLVPAALTALSGYKGVNGAKVNLTTSWTLPRGGFSATLVQVCTDAACATKTGELSLAPTALSATIATTVVGTVNASDFKQLRVWGLNTEGTVLQVNFQACPGVPAGTACP